MAAAEASLSRKSPTNRAEVLPYQRSSADRADFSAPLMPCHMRPQGKPKESAGRWGNGLRCATFFVGWHAGNSSLATNPRLRILHFEKLTNSPTELCVVF